MPGMGEGGAEGRKRSGAALRRVRPLGCRFAGRMPAPQFAGWKPAPQLAGWKPAQRSRAGSLRNVYGLEVRATLCGLLRLGLLVVDVHLGHLRVEVELQRYILVRSEVRRVGKECRSR